jgi:quinol monooxygenase YgiN
MAVMAVLEVTARLDAVEELQATMRELVPGTRSFEGCLGIALCAAVDDPAQIMFIEHWASRAHHERYVAWRRERGEADSFVKLCVGPPKVRYFNDIERVVEAT